MAAACRPHRRGRPAQPDAGDAPVGALQAALGRHRWRPAHLHCMIEAPGYETPITHVFRSGDRYLDSDALLGMRANLIAASVAQPADGCAPACHVLAPHFVLNARAGARPPQQPSALHQRRPCADRPSVLSKGNPTVAFDFTRARLYVPLYFLPGIFVILGTIRCPLQQRVEVIASGRNGSLGATQAASKDPQGPARIR